MDRPKVVFFMIITDPDVYIADYAVKSYQKIKGVDFRLRIYSNYVSPGLKEQYFPKWSQLDYVEIIKNEHHDTVPKPSGPGLEGPFEKCTVIWDRELRKIQSPYHAQVDGDFEILNPRFIYVMFSRLESAPELVAISTDGDHDARTVFDTYSKEYIIANSRLHTWFCIYKRTALRCDVSHLYNEEILESGSIRRNTWDSSGYFQRALREDFGFKLVVLDPMYQSDFIHYGAFSKNRQLNERNIAFYRRVKLIRKVGLPGIGRGRIIGRLLDYLFLRHIDRSRYWQGWGVKW